MESRVLVLAPRGRDGAVIAELLRGHSHAVEVCTDTASLLDAMSQGAALAVVVEEVLAKSDFSGLDAWLSGQPPWSDFPFIVLGNGGKEARSRAALDRLDRLGNVILLERPLHTEGLLRTVASAIGGRRRQYEARARIEDLRDRETKFRAITESMPQIVWSAQPDGHHDFYNERWYAFSGTSPARADSDDWKHFYHPDDRERAWAAWDRSLATGEDYNIEYRLRRHDGVYVWVLGRASPIRDERGSIVRWMGTCTDIEDIVSARETQARSREDLSRLVDERTEDLQTALAQLRAEAADRERAEEALRQSQKLEAVGQLTGGVAHDFNNLLTIIGSSVGFLRRPGLPDERRQRYIDAISDTVERAAKLTGQLLAFARRQPLKPEVFDVGHQVESVAELVRPLVGSRVRIHLDLRDPTCFAEADIGQFETSLVNLAVNARDAMNEEGELRIVVTEVDTVPPSHGHPRRLGDFVAVSVCDTGTGIPPEKLEQIFEPFYTTKEVGKGTGLGLSQVFGFAKQSGGEVEVASEVGHGSTFTIYLPRAQRPPDVHPPLLAQEPRTNGFGARVLVVEDNEAVGQFSTELLQDLGYETTWAADAKQALERLAEDGVRFDLVFSDVIMPGMNGVELAEVVRDRYPGLPVVLTSGYSNILAEDGRHGFDLIQKPYSVEALSRMLRKALSGRSPVAQEPRR